MSFDGTLLNQGRFTSTGNAKNIYLRSDMDYMYVYNETRIIAFGAGTIVQNYWQRGMDNAEGIAYVKLAADDSLSPRGMAAGGFTLIDESSDPVGALNATVTQVDNAVPPLVTLASTAGLSDGDVVRMLDITGAQQLGGLDFTIANLVANTEFELEFMAQIVDTGGIAAGTLRRVAFDPMYYPRTRYISAITQAAQALITLTVDHSYSVDELVKFIVPTVYGMTQMNNLQGQITAIDLPNNTITVDIDSQAFDAFAFPLSAIQPFTPAQVVPVGSATVALDDATTNEAQIGMELGTGVVGTTGDIIWWRAGKSTTIDNQ